MLSILHCITQNKCVSVLFRWYLSKETTKHTQYCRAEVEQGQESESESESERLRHAHTYAVNNPKYLHRNKRCCWTFPFVPWFRSLLQQQQQQLSHPSNLNVPQIQSRCIWRQSTWITRTSNMVILCINYVFPHPPSHTHDSSILFT